MKQILLVMMMLLGAMAISAQQDPPPPSVGKLIYAKDHPTPCFNDAFLQFVNDESNVRVAPKLVEVKLHDTKLFEHPVVVMGGKDSFTLTDQEVKYLRQYLEHGGFLLASSKCTDAAWDASFRKTMAQVLPDGKLEPLPNDHPIMKVLYDIKGAQTVRDYDKPLWAIKVDKRVVVLYSPVGLNDSAAMGSACCCCGSNEVRNARWINANAVVYAMTR